MATIINIADINGKIAAALGIDIHNVLRVTITLSDKLPLVQIEKWLPFELGGPLSKVLEEYELRPKQ